MDQRKRRMLIAAGIGLAVVLLVLAWIFGRLGGAGDDASAIRALTKDSFSAFESRDWDRICQMSWPPEEREALRKRLDPAGKAIRLDDAPEFSRLSINGNEASMEIKVRYRILLSSSVNEEKLKAWYVKRDGLWYLDSKRTLEGINGLRP